MRILDRYLIRQYTRNMLLIAAVFVSLFLIIDFFEKFRMFLSNHATFSQIGRYYLFMMPTVVSQSLPVAVLLASLLTFGALSRHGEITALKANGIDLRRVALPVVLLSLLVSLLIFYLNESLTPPFYERAEQIRLVEVQKRSSPGSFKQDQIWYRGAKGIYNFRLFDPRTATLRGITLHYLDREMNLAMRVDAERGEWRDGGWLFHNVLVARFAEEGPPAITRAKQMTVDLPERPSDFRFVQKDVAAMGYAELERYIGKLRQEGYDASRYVVDLHGKLAFPLVTVLLAVIGLSFSLRHERSGGMAQGIGAGLVIGFSYWLFFAFGMSLGRAGTLPPLPAAWFANLVFAALALVLIRRVRR